MAWKQGNHMKERKEKGTWIGDLLARIVFQTGTGLCALMLGILVPGFEVYAGEQGCQWGYQQEQKQEQHMQLSDEADNYLAVMLEDYDFTGLDEELAAYFPDLSIHADGIMKMLLDGKVQEVLRLFGQQIKGKLWGEVPFARQVFLYVLVLGISSSFFTGFADLFAGARQEKIAFYLLYMMLVGILVLVMTKISTITSQVFTLILDFVKTFIPVYFISVGAANGTGTAVVYYQVMLLVIYFVEAFVCKALLPIAYSYMLLGILNGLWAEERLTLLLDLLKKAVLVSLKAVLFLITGLSLIQSMIVPVVDSFKNTAIHKVVSVIPGIGGLTGGVTELLLGAAVLVKNSFGVFLLILLLSICLIPVLKIGVLACSVKLSAAITGMISDKRISDCADHIGEGCFLVLRCVFTSIALFFIVIAVVAYSVRM